MFTTTQGTTVKVTIDFVDVDGVPLDPVPVACQILRPGVSEAENVDVTDDADVVGRFSVEIDTSHDDTGRYVVRFTGEDIAKEGEFFTPETRF